MLIYEICAVVAALSAAALACWGIITMRAAKSAMERLQQTNTLVQLQLDEVHKETVRLLKQSNQLAKQASDTMESANHWVAAAYHAGEAVQGMTASFKETTQSLSHSVRTAADRAVQHSERHAVPLLQAVHTLWSVWEGIRSFQLYSTKGEDSHGKQG